MFDPVIARFTSIDPVLGTFAEPMTLHAYFYCLNNPINRTDLTGEFSFVETMTVAAKWTSMAVTIGGTAWSVYDAAQQLAQGVAL